MEFLAKSVAVPLIETGLGIASTLSAPVVAAGSLALTLGMR